MLIFLCFAPWVLIIFITSLERRARFKYVIKATIKDHAGFASVTKEWESNSEKLRLLLAEAATNTSKAFQTLQETELKSEIILATALQNIATVFYYSLISDHVKIAGAECRLHVLPCILVDDEVLVEEVTKLRKELADRGWEMVIACY